MTALLVALLGFVIVCAGAAVLLGAMFAFDREDRVSDKWLEQEERRAHVRSVGHVEHQLYVDGKLALEHENEGTCRAVGAAIVGAQRGAVRG
jgi:hypothetical protein